MDTRRGRPPELEDPTWLRQRYQVAGDITIAGELGVGRNTVRQARARFGIASRAPGRRGHHSPVAPVEGRVAAMQIASRIVSESGPGGPGGTFDLIAARVRSVHQARIAGDRPALEDALVGLGAAAGLMLDSLDRLAH